MKFIKHPLIILLVTLAVVGAAFTVSAPVASGAEYFAIVDSFGKRARGAHLDVAVDTASGRHDVQFDIFNAGGVPIAQFMGTTNPYGLVSTTPFGNLFAVPAEPPLLVRARTLAYAPSAATLYVDSLGAPLTVGLWPTNRLNGTAFAMGKEFSVALGSFRNAWIMAANVGGTEQAVDISKGTRSADGAGIFSNPRVGPYGIWKAVLTQNEAQSNLIVTSNGPIIVQVVIDDGKSIQSFQVLPSV